MLILRHPYTILRETDVAYETDKGGTPIKARKRTYDYVVSEAKGTYRTPPATLDLFADLHRLIKEECGTDIPAEVRAMIREWKKKADGK